MMGATVARAVLLASGIAAASAQTEHFAGATMCCNWRTKPLVREPRSLAAALSISAAASA
jgi:hypothetical protein